MSKKKTKNFDSDEVNLIPIFSLLWDKKIFIFKTLIIFSFLGISYSLSLKNVFTASSTFYPHYERVNNSSSLRNLAGLAGINLSNEFNNSDVPPTLYPQLIKSSPFKKNILDQKIKIDNMESTYRKYLMSKKDSYLNGVIDYILKTPFKIIHFISEKFSKKVNSNKLSSELNPDYIVINPIDYVLHRYLDKNIKIEVNQKNNYIKLIVTDESPEVAAIIASKAEKILQESIINYKLKNIRSLYQFTIQQFELSKNKFYQLQDSLANFKDSNRNIKSDVFKNQLERLESEYTISGSIYNELAINKERTKIEVQKNTPIFTIISPVNLPIEKSSPSRFNIVLIFNFMGLFMIITWLFLKDSLIDIKKRIINN